MHTCTPAHAHNTLINTHTHTHIRPPPPPPPTHTQYQVKEDFISEGEHPLTLAAGSVVEVLDNNIAGKWFVRTVGGALDHGWVPSAILEKIGGGDDVDFGGKKKWVQITAGEQPCLLSVAASSEDDPTLEGGLILRGQSMTPPPLPPQYTKGLAYTQGSEYDPTPPPPPPPTPKGWAYTQGSEYDPTLEYTKGWAYSPTSLRVSLS